MIPTPQECISLLDFQYQSYRYKRLLSKQYNYINIPKNREKILDKSEKLYKIVTNSSKNKMTAFYKSLSCNFKLLEEKRNLYKAKE